MFNITPPRWPLVNPVGRFQAVSSGCKWLGSPAARESFSANRPLDLLSALLHTISLWHSPGRVSFSHLAWELKTFHVCHLASQYLTCSLIYFKLLFYITYNNFKKGHLGTYVMLRILTASYSCILQCIHFMNILDFFWKFPRSKILHHVSAAKREFFAMSLQPKEIANLRISI